MSEEQKDTHKAIEYSKNLVEGLEGTAVSASLYTILHGIINNTILHEYLPDASSITFLLNALLSGSFGTMSLFAREYREDVIDGYPPYSTAFLSLFGGYALYDSTRLLREGSLSKDMVMHHVLGFAGVLGTMTARKLVFLPAASMVDEYSLLSVYWFNRVRRQRGEVKSIARASVVRLISTILLRTFTVPSLLLMQYSLLKRQLRLKNARHGEHKQVEFVNVMRELFARVPAWVLCANAVNGSIFTVLNLYWTAQMLRNHRRQRAPRLAMDRYRY